MVARILLQPFFYLPESWNGIDEHLLLLAKHLDPNEFELVVAVGESDGPQTRELARRAGLDWVALPPNRKSSTARLQDLRGLYRSVAPDVVHFHSPAAGGQVIPAAAARMAGAVSLLTIHQYQPWLLPFRTRALNRMAQRLLYRRIIAVSGDVRASAAARCGFAAGSIDVVHNGIDRPAVPGVDGHYARATEVVIGYFGRLSREKGVDILIEALALARDAGCDCRALIVGDGPERPALEALTVARHLDHRVTFSGFVPNASTMMSQVDIVAHTPRYEGFGLVVLEAMASARPVIIAPAPGGLGEMVVDGETGLVARERSPAAIAAVIRQLVADPVLRVRMGRNGEARWRTHFRASRMASQVAGIYGGLVTADKRPMADSAITGDAGSTRQPPDVNEAEVPSRNGATAPR